jgi:hypothetical protein
MFADMEKLEEMLELLSSMTNDSEDREAKDPSSPIVFVGQINEKIEGTTQVRCNIVVTSTGSESDDIIRYIETVVISLPVYVEPCEESLKYIEFLKKKYEREVAELEIKKDALVKKITVAGFTVLKGVLSV